MKHLIQVLFMLNRIAEAPNVEGDKLSVILETTREYVSSNSGSSNYNKTTGLTFTLTREDMIAFKDQPVDTSMYNNFVINENIFLFLVVVFKIWFLKFICLNSYKLFILLKNMKII